MIPVIPRTQTRHFSGQTMSIIKNIIAGGSRDSLEKFESEMAGYTGVSHAVGYSSGRSACRALFECLGYAAGTSVLVPSLNYPAIPRTLELLGLRIIWVPLKVPGLEPDYDGIDAADAESASAFILPHYYGIPSDVEKALRFCDKYGIDLIEDCAHAQGSFYRDKHVGCFGRAGFISFETSKPMNTLGGGMLLTGDGDLAERLNISRPESRGIPIKGILKSYAEAAITSRWVYTVSLFPLLYGPRLKGVPDFLEEGLEGPAAREVQALSDLQAELGLRHLSRFEWYLAGLRRQFDLIHGLLVKSGLAVRVADGAQPNGYMTAGYHEDAGGIAAAFYKKGVDVKLRYMQDCQDLGIGAGGARCPRIAGGMFHLPLRTGISDRGIAGYASVVRDVLRDFSSEVF
ncbi:MAG TPA: aminotransferase class I/II-fold pyridoxal phosphate-dependent enzyme [bacterium]|nr:aminotransferase class I/II-fold pyridoxal phosphate-dependent enzyme [bacterium]